MLYEDTSLNGMFRYDIAFGLSIMIRKYFDLTKKGRELLKLIEGEIDKSKLRDVIDYEIDYIKKSYEQELSEKDNEINKKDNQIQEKNNEINKKDEEIKILKAKLKENGIN